MYRAHYRGKVLKLANATGHNISTIGYGARTPASIVEQLQSAGIRYVVDVRSSPFSRQQPEFSREPLQRLLADSGLKYVFMGDQLGGRPPDASCYTNGRVDYEKCREQDFFRAGVRRLLDACDQGLPLCILCSEGRPVNCHRSKLIGVALEEDGVQVLHLLPDGGVCSQADVIRELTRGQQSMFGDHFLSRRAYR